MTRSFIYVFLLFNVTCSLYIKYQPLYLLICNANDVLLHFSLNVKAATLIFISGCGSAISSATEGKSGLIYNLVKS